LPDTLGLTQRRRTTFGRFQRLGFRRPDRVPHLPARRLREFNEGSLI
jgi:hypothetical protein